MIPKFKNGQFEIRFHQHERTSLVKVAELCTVLSNMSPINETLQDTADTAAKALATLLHITAPAEKTEE